MKEVEGIAEDLLTGLTDEEDWLVRENGCREGGGRDTREDEEFTCKKLSLWYAIGVQREIGID